MVNVEVRLGLLKSEPVQPTDGLRSSRFIIHRSYFTYFFTYLNDCVSTFFPFEIVISFKKDILFNAILGVVQKTMRTSNRNLGVKRLCIIIQTCSCKWKLGLEIGTMAWYFVLESSFRNFFSQNLYHKMQYNIQQEF